MEIYFMRHGESTADIENKIESRYDAALTEKGLEQAKKISSFFKENQIDFQKIISSPLKRAKETSKIISEQLKVEIIYDELLMEFDRGILCGLKRKEADEKYPAPYFRNRFDRFPENSGESVLELRTRALLFLNKIISSKKEKILVVSHGRFLNELISVILNIPTLYNESNGTIFSFNDCEYLRLKYIEKKDSWVFYEKKHIL